jgi:hypothetical protein
VGSNPTASASKFLPSPQLKFRFGKIHDRSLSSKGTKLGVKIQVTDPRDRPVANARVFVSWVSGGHSERRTDESGIADLGTSAGTAEYIQVDGKSVSGRIWLDINKVHRVVRPY